MKRAVILAHYDRDGIIDPYVIHAALAYRAVADRLVLVSASARSLPVELGGAVDQFLARENIAYDFGSWRDGLAILGDRHGYDEILFVNDSVYGPLFDLRPAFTDPRIRDADVWGMAMSAEGVPHVQSWFFSMRGAALAAPQFDQFWASVAPQKTKEAVIDRYEIGISRTFESAGCRIAALVDGRQEPPPTYREILENVSPWRPWPFLRHLRGLRRRGPPYNPSDLHWRRLWQAGVPYVKVGLFRRNQYRLDTNRVLAGVANLSPAWAALIRNHLARLATCVR